MNSIPKTFAEAFPPGRPLQLPPHLRLRFPVGASANLCHHGHSVLANQQASQPARDVSRSFGSDSIGQEWQPLRNRSRFIVANVIEAWRSGIHGRKGGRRCVVNMDKLPIACSLTDDGDSTLLYLFEHRPIPAQRGAGPVKAAITKHESLNSGLAQNCRFQMENCLE